MEITGQQTIAAPRQAVWDALLDPAVLQRCLPGCDRVEQTTPDRYQVVLTAAVGPLRARMSGTLQVTEAQPPQACTLVFEGQGGAVGFGSGRATVTLADAPEGTLLSYNTQAQVGGKLAQVGSRLIDSVARKLADDFFAALRRQLAPPAEASTPAAPNPPEAAAQPAAAAQAAAPAAAPAPALASAPAPAAVAPRGATATPTAQVPAWWLLVAALLGSAATLAGVLAAH